MPLSSSSHYTPAGLVRPRRSKDKDNKATSSSHAHRRNKDASRSRHRTPPRSPHLSLSTVSSHSSATLDQLPPLPESGTASPGSTTSADTGECERVSIPGHSTFPYQLQTPAALQQYLDTEDDDHEKLTRSTPALDNPRDQAQLDSCFRPKSTDNTSLPLDSQTATPLAANTQQTAHMPIDSPESPSFFHQALKLPSPTSTVLSPRMIKSVCEPQTSSSSSSSPPPTNTFASWEQPHPVVSSPILRHPHPQHRSTYMASSPTYSQMVPYYGPVAGESQFSSPYFGAHPGHLPHPQHPMADFKNAPSYTMASYPGFGQMQQSFPQSQAAPPPVFSPHSTQVSIAGDGFPLSPPPLAGGSVKSVGRTDSIVHSNDDDAVDLLHRVQSAIPDLTDLINRYRHTSGQLNVQENTIRQTEAQKAEKVAALQQKEDYVEKLKKELAAAESGHAADTSKLRLQLGNMEEKHKELSDHLRAHERTKLGLETAVQALQTEKETLVKAHHEEKSNFQQEYEDRHKSLSETLTRERQTIEDQCRQETDTLLQERLVERDRLHSQEKAALEASLARQKREAEADHDREKRSLEKVIMDRKQELDDVKKKHARDLDAWQDERRTLLKDKEIGFTQMLNRVEGEKHKIYSEHENKLQQVRNTWEQEKARLREAADENTTALRAELEKVEAEHEADKAKSSKLITELRESTRRIGLEKEQLARVVESFGKVTDLRGRGEPFYNTAFKTLRRQVTQAASRYFKDLPSLKAPAKLPQGVPKDLPNFLSQTESSQGLRAAYIEHTIMSIVTRRIFEPYLFVLQTDETRTIGQAFAQVAATIRNKSTMKESCWRQQTLFAIYSSADAKTSINKVAGEIIEEIFAATKALAARKWHSHIHEALRRLVKTAVEAWRYASMEPSRITASMSKATVVRNVNDNTSGSAAVALVLFPRIAREPLHEDLRNEMNKDDKGCIYSEGQVVKWDDPVLLACRAEEKRGHSPPELNHRKLDKSNTPFTTHSSGKENSTAARSEERTGSPLLPKDASQSQSPNFGGRSNDDASYSSSSGSDTDRTPQPGSKEMQHPDLEDLDSLGEPAASLHRYEGRSDLSVDSKIEWQGDSSPMEKQKHAGVDTDSQWKW